MTKILSTAAFTVLKEKADNYDAVVNSVAAKGEGVDAADVTLENVQAVINAEESAGDSVLQATVTELEGAVETLNTTITELTTERDTLKTENEVLSALPGAESVVAIPEAEASAVATDTVLEFAAKNQGNILAIAAEMKKQGY